MARKSPSQRAPVSEPSRPIPSASPLLCGVESAAGPTAPSVGPSEASGCLGAAGSDDTEMSDADSVASEDLAGKAARLLAARRGEAGQAQVEGLQLQTNGQERA